MKTNAIALFGNIEKDKTEYSVGGPPSEKKA